MHQVTLCNVSPAAFSGCQQFKSMDVQNRLAFVREKQLCYNCLRGGHRSSECSLNRVCSVPGCQKKHTKFLHPTSANSRPLTNSGDNRQESGLVTSNGYAEVGDSIECVQHSVIGAGVHTALPILPVCVKNPATGAEVKTCALLDSGSTHSFCSSSLVRKIELTGENVSLSLTTLERSGSHMSTMAVSIEVSSLDGGEQVIVESTYVKDTLPISVMNMATVEDVKHWPHLRDIKLPSVNTDSI